MKHLLYVVVILCASSIALADSAAYEGSAFGIFGAYALEYGPFQTQAGLNNAQYWEWVDGHFQQLGAHWTRSNLQFMWDICEPTIGGGFVWTNSMVTDGVITNVYEPGNDVNWLGVFHEGGGPIPPPPPRTPLRNPLDDPTAYQNFVRAAVERYDGDGVGDADPYVRVKYWQCGNEYPGWSSSGRTQAQYVQFVQLIAQAARQADPNAKIVLIAQTQGFTVDTWLSQTIQALAPGTFNAVDVHHWGRAGNWQMTAIPQIRQLLNSRGMTNVEIWSCENGTWYGQPTEQPFMQTEAEQARSLIKRYVYNRYRGLDKLFWNNLMEWRNFNGNSGSVYNSMGLVGDGVGSGEDPARFNVRRVSYWAYKMLAANTDNHIVFPATAMSLPLPGTLYGYKYVSRSAGRATYILWSESGTQQVTFPINTATSQVTNMITDLAGNLQYDQTVSASAGNITIQVGLDPMMVVEQGTLIYPPLAEPSANAPAASTAGLVLTAFLMVVLTIARRGHKTHRY